MVSFASSFNCKKNIMKSTLSTILFVFSLALQAQIEIPTYNGGLIFQAKDKSFKAKLNFRMQNLMTVDFANNGAETKTNMLVRRARIKLAGYALNPKWKYKFEMGLSNRDIGASSDFEQVNSASRLILDAVVKYQAHKNLELWFGQTKLPGNRERLISSQNLQFVDRSLVNSSFNIDRDMGFQAHYSKTIGKSVARAKGAWSMGDGRNITKGNFGGFGFTGRLEFLPFGEFSKRGDYFSADLTRESQLKLAFGLTYDLNDDASRQGGQLKGFVFDKSGDEIFTDLSSVMFDWMFKYKGFSFQGEFIDKIGDKRASMLFATAIPENRFRTGRGFNAQLGYVFENNIELAGRFTRISPNYYSSLNELNEYTIGLSKYLKGHKLKVQTDLSLTDKKYISKGENAYRWRFQVEFGF